MGFYIDWPTVSVIVVVSAIISLTWQAVRLAIWSSKVILDLCHQIRRLESGKIRGALPVRDEVSL